METVVDDAAKKAIDSAKIIADTGAVLYCADMIGDYADDQHYYENAMAGDEGVEWVFHTKQVNSLLHGVWFV